MWTIGILALLALGAAAQSPPSPSVTNAIEKLLCDMMKDDTNMNELIKLGCEEVHAVFPTVPSLTCEMGVAQAVASAQSEMCNQTQGGGLLQAEQRVSVGSCAYLQDPSRESLIEQMFCTELESLAPILPDAECKILARYLYGKVEQECDTACTVFKNDTAKAAAQAKICNAVATRLPSLKAQCMDVTEQMWSLAATACTGDSVEEGLPSPSEVLCEAFKLGGKEIVTESCSYLAKEFSIPEDLCDTGMTKMLDMATAKCPNFNIVVV